MYQHTQISTLTALGTLTNIPSWLIEAGANEAQIRDTSWAGYGDEGYWTVSISSPTFDAATEILTGEIADYTADLDTKSWTGTYVKRLLTAEELAARNPVPTTISDRQFAQALAHQGVITKDEALAFVKSGDIPPLLQTALDAVEDEDAKFDMMIAVSGATMFERNNPSTLALASAMGWTPTQMDDLWRYAASLV